MRVRTRTGLSELMIFHVGTLPIVDEVEPNTDFESPQVIDKNVSVQGRIDREDVDYYVIEAKQGERISAEVFGMRFGRSQGGRYFDPYLAVLDADRFELAVSDDHPLVWNDCLISFIAPADGKYTIQVRDAAYNGDGQAYYLLHVGNFPRPVTSIPSGGKPGETVSVTFLGDPLGPITREVTLPEEIPADRFSLEVQDEYGIAPSNIPFLLSDSNSVLEENPSNVPAKLTPREPPVAFNGVISEPGQLDWMKILGKKDQEYEIFGYAREHRSGLDPFIGVHLTRDGKNLGYNDDQRNQPDAYLKFKAPEDGEYQVIIFDHLRNGDPNYTYRVEVKPVAASLSAEPIEFQRYVQPQIEIPQGGGSGIVANIRRNGFGGPVNFRSEDLPPGVRIECPESWRSDGSASVVFFAEDDAPVGGKFSEIVAFRDDPSNPDAQLTGRLSQDVLMTRSGGSSVLVERMNRLPIIVTEKLPFRCWVETPPVPLVQNGSLNLVVHCERQEGWDEEIQLQLLQDPPGVRSSGSVKIPKGETRAEIPLNAGDRAAVRESMIAVRCSAQVGNGKRETCTSFVPLRVEEKYVDFEFTQAAGEQGQQVPYLLKVTQRKPYEGEATVELLGLPAKATAEPLKLTKDQTELLFNVNVDAETPTGMHKGLVCRVHVPENGATILHTLGSGNLRIDKPTAPPAEKKDEPKQEVAKTEPPKKPLSRLEQLRLQQQQREQADSGGE